MYGSGAYGQSAYTFTVSLAFISTSVSPGAYGYSSILTSLSGVIEIVEPSDYNYLGSDTINSGIEILRPFKQFGSGSYGSGAYGQPSSVESYNPSLYVYSGKPANSSSIGLVEPSNYNYSGIQVLGVGEAVVGDSVYNYTAIQCQDGVTNIVGDGNYVYVGIQEIGSAYPFLDTIIIVHDYNSEIIEVS